MTGLHNKRHFTIVFEGDLAAFPTNIFKASFPHGKPVAAGFGDAFETIDRLIEEISGGPIPIKGAGGE